MFLGSFTGQGAWPCFQSPGTGPFPVSVRFLLQLCPGRAVVLLTASSERLLGSVCALAGGEVPC